MTAGNGSDAQLRELEIALTSGRPLPESVAAAASEPATDDVVARVDAVAERCQEAGRYAKDHGAYLDEVSTAFAGKLRAMTAEYARNMLAAEERKNGELRRILGKIAG